MSALEKFGTAFLLDFLQWLESEDISLATEGYRYPSGKWDLCIYSGNKQALLEKYIEQLITPKEEE